jgi:hypothetical protein
VSGGRSAEPAVGAYLEHFGTEAEPSGSVTVLPTTSSGPTGAGSVIFYGNGFPGGAGRTGR